MQLLSGTQGASRLREAFGGLAQAQIHLPWHSQVSSHRHDTLCSVFCPLYPHRPFPIPTVFPSSQALGPIPIPAGQTPSFPLLRSSEAFKSTSLLGCFITWLCGTIPEAVVIFTAPRMQFGYWKHRKLRRSVWGWVGIRPKNSWKMLGKSRWRVTLYHPCS